MTFSITVEDAGKVMAKLAKIPKDAGDAGTAAASSYLVGVLANKETPAYKYIDRKHVPWASDKQRRFVMAKIRSGEIDVPYKRGGKKSGVHSAWKLMARDGKMVIENDKDYAKWLYSEQQSRRHGLIGWKKITQILTTYGRKITDAFDRGVATYLKKVGLS